jgi:hypothetical protein
VVRKFKVIYDGDQGGSVANSVVIPLQTLYPVSFVTEWSPVSGSGIGGNVEFANSGNGVPVANSQYVTIGSGDEFDTFFIVEEGTWFGLMGQNNNITMGGGFVSVNCYGQLIPTNQLELPYCIGNPN